MTERRVGESRRAERLGDVDRPGNLDFVPVRLERVRVWQQRLEMPGPRVDENKTRMGRSLTGARDPRYPKGRSRYAKWDYAPTLSDPIGSRRPEQAREDPA